MHPTRFQEPHHSTHSNIHNSNTYSCNYINQNRRERFHNVFRTPSVNLEQIPLYAKRLKSRARKAYCLCSESPRSVAAALVARRGPVPRSFRAEAAGNFPCRAEYRNNGVRKRSARINGVRQGPLIEPGLQLRGSLRNLPIYIFGLLNGAATRGVIRGANFLDYPRRRLYIHLRAGKPAVTASKVRQRGVDHAIASSRAGWLAARAPSKF